MKNLKKLSYPTPIITNAHHNRNIAIKCFEAGKTPKEIADQFPEVFEIKEGKLSQIYDSIYPDTGIKETKYMITDVAVVCFIGKLVKYRKGAIV